MGAPRVCVPRRVLASQLLTTQEPSKQELCVPKKTEAQGGLAPRQASGGPGGPSPVALAPCCWLVAQELCPTAVPQGHSASRPPWSLVFWDDSEQAAVGGSSHTQRLPASLRCRSAHHLASTGTSTLGPWAYRVCARSLHHCRRATSQARLAVWASACPLLMPA